MEIQYLIPHPPVPWSAPLKGRNGFYSPRSEEKQRDVLYIKAQKVVELKGPLWVDIIFYMPIPASLSEKKKSALENAWHIKKPDGDNLGKLVFDVLQSAGVFKNDSQICHSTITKVYSEYPRTKIYIGEL